MAIKKARSVALGATAFAALSAALAAMPAAAVVINDGYTPGSIVDTTNITGVGQMVVDEGDGFVGLCTATLINPRTVVLAAHCVNDAPSTSYGANQGGTAIGVGFQANNLPSIQDWFQSSFQTSKTNQFYNGSYVVYNQHSLDLGPDNNFLQGDVALIAFDTPVTGVPTTDMLFSPLSGPVHATITGYGDNGIGTTGQGSLDFKRRVAENIVSVLGSLDDVDGFLFGSPDGLPQNLYQIDFNSPGYANRFDFGIFGDLPLDKEGITAPGDSGGPLLIDQAFAKPVIAGVLSGGSRYYNAQPGASYGTTSFYQPLYLFWDWIVANNPYKYVGAKAGDGSWTDPNHWVINLDPAYQIIGANGQLVNGLPTTPAAGIDGTTPKFGNVCDGVECVDLASGVIVPQSPTDGTPQAAASGSATASATTNDKGASQLALGSSAIHEAQDAPEQMINAPTAVLDPVGDPPAEGSALVGGELVQGAPGSSGFVPNDTDGDITTGAPARYYDVTLSADGTTTLSGADIIIDRLKLAGNKANLTIDADAGLASLIDTTQTAGTMTVDGTYISIGDYDLIGGLLQGSGTVIAPNLISVMGAIAPGRLGTIGTLTVGGNVIMSSASRTYIDIGPNGTSDHLDIVANPFIDPAAANVLTGVGDLGGLLALTPVAGYRPTYGDSFTLITAEGGLQDAFGAVTSLSAILYPSITQTANTLSVTIKARPYQGVINTASPIQSAYAQLLDSSRASSALKSFYYQSDYLSQEQIQASLEAAGPYAQQTEVGLVRMQDEALAKFYRDRLSLLRSGGASEQLAVLGNPLGVVRTGYQTAQDVAMGLMQANPAQQSTAVPLPEGVSAYVAGGYLDGSSRPLPNLLSGKKDDLSGWYVAGGLEKQIDDKMTAGMSASYSHGKGDALAGESARSNMFQLAAYGSYSFGGGAFINTSVSGGLLQVKTRRQFSLGDATAKLHNEENAPIVSGEIALGYDLKMSGLKFTPIASIRASHLEFEGGQESGGLGSLTYAKRNFNSIQARAGGQISFDSGNIRPHIDAAYVHDFRKNGADIFAHFTGADVPNADFGSFGRDRNWGEAGGGLTVVGPTVDIGVSADTVFKRQDLSYQIYRGSVTFHF
ncbi:autotransporter domain-containing protein [Sphingomonas abietis]|uniref:Autotransporter domain-containing protein n=1 Tax=Sphingomonas abietis TaxID=3012344 RepID=A0ABY7NR77_9SPHN|nr:autotransporter domain-containing protein [Sphingomonas abietis]WBO24040.1 autotransporter domain-containing protein [Sphingomonas abietis]